MVFFLVQGHVHQCTCFLFSGFSVCSFIYEYEGYDINLIMENNLPIYRQNAPVIIRVKAFSQKIGKLFSELKLVTDNLPLQLHISRLLQTIHIAAVHGIDIYSHSELTLALHYKWEFYFDE